MQFFHKPPGRGLAWTVLSAIVFLPGLASAQEGFFDGFLEGPISEITLSNDPSDGLQGTVKINGITANVLDSTPISTPTFSGLTLAQMTGPLPGRWSGFENGTCLCATSFNPVTGVINIVDFVAEPAENVAIAFVTEHNCENANCSGPGDVLRIGGVRVVANDDYRIPSPLPTDAAFFEANLSNAANTPAGQEPVQGALEGHVAAVEGYYGDFGGEPAIYYYALEIEGAARLNPEVIEVAIERAQCRDRDGGQYRIRGTVSEPGRGDVQISALDDNGSEVLGSATPIEDPETGIVTWTFSGNGITGCKATVQADYAGGTENNGGTAVGEVAIR